MTPAQSALSRGCRLLAQSVLRPVGFSGSGRKFLRRDPGVTGLIEIQVSRTSTADYLTFAVNYGVVIPALFQAVASEGPRSLTYTSYHWARHWHDPSTQEERWWPVRATDDPQEIAEELSRSSKLQILPDLERLRDPAAVAALWQAGNGLGLSAGMRLALLPLLLIELGRRDEANAAIAELRARSDGDAEFALRRLRRRLSSASMPNKQRRVAAGGLAFAAERR
jgi:hypothetical protein